MKKFLISFFLISIVILLMGCNSVKLKKESSNLSSNIDLHSSESSILNISDFSFLKIGMNRSDVIKKVGNPSTTTGSGLILDVYNLKDGTYIIMNFGPKRDVLLYASLYNKDGTVKSILGTVNNS